MTTQVTISLAAGATHQAAIQPASSTTVIFLQPGESSTFTLPVNVTEGPEVISDPGVPSSLT